MAFDFDTARFNMIQQQIRPWNVTDDKVLEVMSQIPRENFVPTAYRQVAFTDTEIPLGHGEVTLSPKIEAHLLQALKIRPQDHILEIGTGCGYLTACLAKLSTHVVSHDIHEDFIRQADAKLKQHHLQNITLEHKDSLANWDKNQRYDVIVFTGSIPVLEEQYQACLKPKGRMFVIVGQAPVMEAIVITRTDESQQCQYQSVLETNCPPLKIPDQIPQFVF